MITATLRATIAVTLFLLSAFVPASADRSLPAPAEHPDAQRISVQTQGAGKDVILISGLASSREVWAALTAHLGNGYRLHRLELAGFASTPAVANREGELIAPAVEAIAEYTRTQHLEAPRRADVAFYINPALIQEFPDGIAISIDHFQKSPSMKSEERRYCHQDSSSCNAILRNSL